MILASLSYFLSSQTKFFFDDLWWSLILNIIGLPEHLLLLKDNYLCSS